MVNICGDGRVDHWSCHFRSTFISLGYFCRIFIWSIAICFRRSLINFMFKHGFYRKINNQAAVWTDSNIIDLLNNVIYTSVRFSTVYTYIWHLLKLDSNFTRQVLSMIQSEIIANIGFARDLFRFVKSVDGRTDGHVRKQWWSLTVIVGRPRGSLTIFSINSIIGVWLFKELLLCRFYSLYLCRYLFILIYRAQQKEAKLFFLSILLLLLLLFWHFPEVRSFFFLAEGFMLIREP